MKKLLVFLILILFCISATGCVWIINVHDKLHLPHPSENVEKIEIYDLGTIHLYDDGYYDTDWGTYERNPEATFENFTDHFYPIQTLQGETVNDFYVRLKNLPISHGFFLVLAAVDPADPVHMGYVVRIIYKDGKYDLISTHLQTYHEADGVYERFARVEIESNWSAFVEEYLNTSDK